MPLNTQILRDGKPLTVKWGGFHVASMVLASWFDNDKSPYVNDWKPSPNAVVKVGPADAFALMDYGQLAASPLGSGEVTLQKEHRFVDAVDGEEFVLLPGDVLIAYRN